MGFWNDYWDLNTRLTVGGFFIAIIAFVLLFPIGAIIKEKYFKKEYLYQCKVSQNSPDGFILVVMKEELIDRWDSLRYLKLNYSDTTRLRAGSLLIIGEILKDSSYAKIYINGRTETAGYTRLENLECWPLIQAQ